MTDQIQSQFCYQDNGLQRRRFLQKACTQHSCSPTSIRGNRIDPKVCRCNCRSDGCRHSALGQQISSYRSIAEKLFSQIRRQRTKLLGVADTLSRSTPVSGELPPHVLQWLSYPTKCALSCPTDSPQAHYFFKRVTPCYGHTTARG
jgi:hypothetical protein